jgi:hypothetical protein
MQGASRFAVGDLESAIGKKYKGRRLPADTISMGNSISAVSLLAGNIALQSASLETGVAVMKKSNDIAKQEGAALIQLLEESLPQPDQSRLDVYA